MRTGMSFGLVPVSTSICWHMSQGADFLDFLCRVTDTWTLRYKPLFVYSYYSLQDLIFLNIGFARVLSCYHEFQLGPIQHGKLYTKCLLVYECLESFITGKNTCSVI
jgi:hypothetical protein